MQKCVRAHTEGGRGGGEARAEAVCCHPGGTGSQAWQPAQVSGRDGGGWWRCSCQEQQLGIPGDLGAVSGADWLPQTTGVSHGLVGWTQGCPTVPDVAQSFKGSEA